MANIKQLVCKTAAALEEPEVRGYMGISLLGHHCPRYIWATFRMAYPRAPINRRMYRLFQRGHREEAVIIQDLNRIGIEVTDSQDEIEFVDGHVKGHCDGIATGVLEAPTSKHLAEFKTMNNKSFNEAMKANSIKISHPQYYAQVQLYMEGFKCEKYLFISVNKDNDAYYVERGKKDPTVIKSLLMMARALVYTTRMPVTAYTRTFYKCRWCPAAGICWMRQPYEKNCRTCVYSEPIDNCKWMCNKYDDEIPFEFQLEGCKKYEAIEL